MSLPPASGHRSFSALWQAPSDTETELIEEVPVAISYGDITHGIMMLTPTDLDDFLVGFSLSEGVIKRATDLLDWTLTPTHTPDALPAYVLDATLSARRQAQYRQRQRQMLGATGCGLCGSDSLESAFAPLEPLTPAPVLPRERLSPLRELLSRAQVLGPRVGAIHAAALVDPNGTLIACREDIGRHNALDKLIGHALRREYSLSGHTLVMSSRCSVELVNKAIIAGASTLVNLAAPSTLAVDQARRYNLNLIHLARDNQPRYYSPERPSL
ncbi:formate dehydrogenase accessory sulfurtransferase FdhD [Saccharospirillum impatiens]|uniref:formate dehydrogenase accessory sulfurtransferase FdhD n=1 Tax=Saccharospirillum impatiens TaxID=169438 RepID=UPI000429ED9A|nr:formate dehydrogenase accessory sulfurtransferase FdhD [Saccharospirillum impatiens]